MPAILEGIPTSISKTKTIQVLCEVQKKIGEI